MLFDLHPIFLVECTCKVLFKVCDESVSRCGDG